MIVVRDFRPSDAERVNQVAVAAFEEFSAHYTDWPAMRGAVARMADLSDHAEIIVAEQEDEIVGAVAYLAPGVRKSAFFDPAWPVIRLLVVDPAHRGLGAGRALTDACMARARRDTAPVVALHTTPIMNIALPMYLRMGFEQHGEGMMINGVPYAVYLKRLG